jgi:YD repeat-containing protein
MRFVCTRIGGLLALVLAAGALLVAAVAAADGGVSGDPRSARPVFVLDKGRFAAFDAPGAGAAEFPRINDRGQIVGSYVDAAGASHGFVRDARGRLTVIAIPGAKETAPLAINNGGVIVGNTCAERPCARRRGFLRDARGRFKTISVPGSVQTQAYGIDDRGRVVGDYLDAAGAGHGYLWEKGRFTTIDVRDAAATTITALNERGEMVGLYFDAAGTSHGFFRSARGRIRTIDAAGVLITVPFDVNNRGQIVGITTTAPSLGPDDNEVRGFVLRDGAGGPFTRIDAPGATDTGASGIDDRGRIVGLYQKPNATPSARRARARQPAPVPGASAWPRAEEGATTTARSPHLGPRTPRRR